MDTDQTDDLFSGNDASAGNQSEPSSHSPTTGEGDPLTSLVGEGKKFKSVEDLARGKMESDAFIQKLQREQAELREELNKRATVDEVLRKIEERTQQRAPDLEEDDTPSDSDGNRSVDLSAIEKMVENKVNEVQSEAQKRRNVLNVKEILVEKFGPNYQEVVDAKLAEMDVGRDWANGLAATSPKAFLNLMGEPKQPSQTGDVAPPQGSMRTTQNTGPVTYGDFEKLRREDPQRYFSPDIQLRMHKMAQENPDEFLKR